MINVFLNDISYAFNNFINVFGIDISLNKNLAKQVLIKMFM